MIQTVVLTGHTISAVRHGVIESKRYDWFFRNPQSKSTTSESPDISFIQKVQVVLVSTTPDQVRLTKALNHDNNIPASPLYGFFLPQVL